jgi:1-hydroxycarotenoid 3,4-desaturase
VFDAIFADAGASFAEAVTLRPLDILARHRWTGGAQLDLFSDISRSADAIGSFAGAAAAAGYREFCDRAERIHATLGDSFIRAPRPNPASLALRVGRRRLGALAGISPFTTMWRALGEHFADPRLRQLFGRYATYCGSSPFQATATLMLVAHVEREGVWAVEGGMRRVVEALVRLAESRGATFRYGAAIESIRVGRGGACGLVLTGGEVVEADAVVANADAGAFAAGLLGPDVARAAAAVPERARSLSALTWSLVAETEGAPLAHHNVCFSDDYQAEFDALRGGRAPDDPTVYVCAPDRREGAPAPAGPERLFLIANAPPNGDGAPLDLTETARCETRTFQRLERCGLSVRRRPGSSVVTTPRDFAASYPGTGGALYGRAAHGWMASFQRPGSRSRIPRLYLAGGSVHPGPGVPMAAISGMLAADSLVEDLASTRPSRRAATLGGMSTP